jgi:hypothetical protein
LAPARADAGAVAQAPAALEAVTRLRALTDRMLGDLDGEPQAWSPPPADVDDRHNRLETACGSWRHELGRPER